MRAFNNRRRGQSLIEAVVALGIISTAVSSALTLAVGSLGAAKDSGATITAGNLAREGIEVVRMIRDSNWLAGNAWDAGITYQSAGSYDYTAIPLIDVTSNAGNWTLDFTPSAVTDSNAKVYRCTVATCSGILGMFRQFVGSATAGYADAGYRRLLTINPICRDGTIVTAATGCATGNDRIGLRVTSQVTWAFSGRAHSRSVEERMYDWR